MGASLVHTYSGIRLQTSDAHNFLSNFDRSPNVISCYRSRLFLASRPQIFRSAKALSASRSRGRTNSAFRVSCECYPRGAATSNRSIPDQILLYPDSSNSAVEVHIFGVDHALMRKEVAEHILAVRPQQVVVETGVNEFHEAATGNVVVYDDDSLMCNYGALGGISRLARELRASEDVLTTDLWQHLVTAMPTEQLAYVAAFVIGSPIVYGDRPKLTTFKRLLHGTSLEELDHAFGALSAQNYEGLLLRGGAASPPGTQEAAPKPNCFQRIVIEERDAVVCDQLMRSVAGADPGRAPVVAVVGSQHVPGITALWAQHTTSMPSSQASCIDVDSLMSVPEPPSSQRHPEVSGSQCHPE
ncbi:hypothetical protein CYMTET_21955, partial [Cymbomonas tetramitiformis]